MVESARIASANGTPEFGGDSVTEKFWISKDRNRPHKGRARFHHRQPGGVRCLTEGKKIESKKREYFLDWVPVNLRD